MISYLHPSILHRPPTFIHYSFIPSSTHYFNPPAIYPLHVYLTAIIVLFVHPSNLYDVDVLCSVAASDFFPLPLLATI
ncbi:hypothetical protein K438DRAFT_1797860 [Mycena galopus ATCC 62051]|nr:hypothetical protein K438DRAFT_1797860 [Mycena galopus ATCC 62051]